MLLNQFYNHSHPLFNVGRTLDEVDRFFGARHRPARFRGTTQSVFPTINVYEDETRTVLVAELPGIDPEALEVTVLKNTVTLKGERPDRTEEGQTVHLRERGTGRFSRMLTLPEAVNPDRVEAQYRNGVLYVSLEKAAEAQVRKISVRS